MDEQSGAMPELSFRRGTVEDWSGVAPIVAETWAEGDYIDQAVWEAWASDAQGYLAVALHGGQIVATGKLTHLGPAEWWAEGLRVDPALRRRGIGQAITEHLIEWFRAYGEGFLRLATSSTNEAAHRIAARHGFRHTISYTLAEAPAQPTDFRNFKLLQPSNLEMVHAYLRRSPMYRINHFAEHGWQMTYLTRDRIAEYLARPDVQIAGWRQFDQLYGLAIIFLDESERYRSSEALYLGYVDAPDDTTLRAMLSGLQGLAAKRGRQKIAWKMPVGMGLERAVGAVGLERVWDWDIWLFERPLRV